MPIHTSARATSSVRKRRKSSLPTAAATSGFSELPAPMTVPVELEAWATMATMRATSRERASRAACSRSRK
jgi:hypothetical protein